MGFLAVLVHLKTLTAYITAGFLKNGEKYTSKEIIVYDIITVITNPIKTTWPQYDDIAFIFILFETSLSSEQSQDQVLPS